MRCVGTLSAWSRTRLNRGQPCYFASRQSVKVVVTSRCRFLVFYFLPKCIARANEYRKCRTRCRMIVLISIALIRSLTVPFQCYSYSLMRVLGKVNRRGNDQKLAPFEQLLAALMTYPVGKWIRLLHTHLHTHTCCRSIMVIALWCQIF